MSQCNLVARQKRQIKDESRMSEVPHIIVTPIRQSLISLGYVARPSVESRGTDTQYDSF